MARILGERVLIDLGTRLTAAEHFLGLGDPLFFRRLISNAKFFKEGRAVIIRQSNQSRERRNALLFQRVFSLGANAIPRG